MGNECSGSDDIYRELNLSMQTHRKMLKEYEEKIKASEALLTSHV